MSKVLQKVSSSRHLRKEGPAASARSPLLLSIHAALYPTSQHTTHLASREKTRKIPRAFTLSFVRNFVNPSLLLLTRRH